MSGHEEQGFAVVDPFAADPSARVALRTRLRPGTERAYEEAHARIPDALADVFRRCGVRGWEIWRDGLDLFHLVEVADFAALEQALRLEPENQAWQQRIGMFLEPGIAAAPLASVWRLPHPSLL